MKQHKADRKLLVAASSGDMAGVRAALEAGAQVTARDGSYLTPLHWAAQYNRTDVVQLLLAKGADPKAKDIDFYTPQDLAEMFGSADAAALLKAVTIRTHAERIKDRRRHGPRQLGE